MIVGYVIIGIAILVTGLTAAIIAIYLREMVGISRRNTLR